MSFAGSFTNPEYVLSIEHGSGAAPCISGLNIDFECPASFHAIAAQLSR